MSCIFCLIVRHPRARLKTIQTNKQTKNELHANHRFTLRRVCLSTTESSRASTFILKDSTGHIDSFVITAPPIENIIVEIIIIFNRINKRSPAEREMASSSQQQRERVKRSPWHQKPAASSRHPHHGSSVRSQNHSAADHLDTTSKVVTQWMRVLAAVGCLLFIALISVNSIGDRRSAGRVTYYHRVESTTQGAVSDATAESPSSRCRVGVLTATWDEKRYQHAQSLCARLNDGSDSPRSSISRCDVISAFDGTQIDGLFLEKMAREGDVVVPVLRDNKKQALLASVATGRTRARMTDLHSSMSRRGFEGIGSVANVLSHVELARSFLDTEGDCFIMLEDDAGLAEHFDAKIARLLRQLRYEGMAAAHFRETRAEGNRKTERRLDGCFDNNHAGDSQAVDPDRLHIT